MSDLLSFSTGMLAAAGERSTLSALWSYVQIFVGFSFIIFVHELGHFIVAKWAGVRVEQFAIGFFREIFGFTRGETRYSFNLLPLGGYVKMLGQEDFEVDTTGELQFKDDPRSFANKSVGARMAIVSAGVIMNLLFAGLLFMIVFLIGKQVPAPRVGAVLPDSPAAMAGMQTGDRVISVDGSAIDEFMDLTMAVTLAKPNQMLNVVIERDGEPKLLQMEPVRNPEKDAFQIGITTPLSNVILAVGPEYDPTDPKSPHIGDRIVEMGGQAVTDENTNVMMNLLFTNPLAYPEVVVERPVNLEDPDSPIKRVTVQLRPRIVLSKTDLRSSTEHLLGMVPLRRVSEVIPGGRADLAGLKVGDTIIEWNGIRYPTGRQIDDSITASAQQNPDRPERDIPIKVSRGPERKIVDLVVRPKVRIVPITGRRSAPSIEAKYNMYADDVLQIGAIVDEVGGVPTPAKAAGLTVGSLIQSVNGEPVKRWLDLFQVLMANAGQDVTLRYLTPDGTPAETTLHVPDSLLARLGVGPEAVIASIAGEETLLIDREGNEVTENPEDEPASGGKNAKKRAMRMPVKYPIAARAALARHVGETVEVRYRPTPIGEIQTAQVTVTEEMLDVWAGGVAYTLDFDPAAETILLRKSNPLAALKVGVKKTYYFVLQVYQVLERLIITRSLSVETISGPVGIVKMGGAVAEKGLTDLLYFLAMISANLAVLNFLPLPIVDGGLMVFLLIEKIKGSPISMKVQVATQVIGLILIGSAFIFVTIIDVWRL